MRIKLLPTRITLVNSLTWPCALSFYLFFSLGASCLVDVTSPRTISIDKEKISSRTRVLPTRITLVKLISMAMRIKNLRPCSLDSSSRVQVALWWFNYAYTCLLREVETGEGAVPFRKRKRLIKRKFSSVPPLFSYKSARPLRKMFHRPCYAYGCVVYLFIVFYDSKS